MCRVLRVRVLEVRWPEHDGQFSDSILVATRQPRGPRFELQGSIEPGHARSDYQVLGQD